MGQPAWANDDQWTWLKSQATEYLKIKGMKKDTIKFWPAFFEEWQSQWPKPALTDVVREADGETVKDPSIADTSSETGAVVEQQSATTTTKKAKKPLTVSIVCTHYCLKEFY
jgi:hypothetical protein